MARPYQRKKYTSKGLLFIGIFLIILGMMALLIINYYTSDSDKNLTYGSRVSLTISICSLGLGLFSLGLSFSSSIKNDINSNENFLRIVDHFEDKRIELFQNLDKGNAEPLIRNIWKMVTYTRRAVKLYEMANITNDNCNEFFNQLKQFLVVSSVPWRGVWVITKDASGNEIKKFIHILRKKDIGHALLICNLFNTFRLNNVQKGELEAYIDMMEYLHNTTPE
jgi:hypothetical protein